MRGQRSRDIVSITDFNQFNASVRRIDRGRGVY
jgi:hypothetical protein